MQLQLPQLEDDQRQSPPSPRVRAPIERKVDAAVRAGDSMGWRIITDRAQMNGLSAEWSRLADRCGAGLFITPEWVQAWLATIGQDVEPRVVTAWEPNAGKQDDRLVAIWPLGLRQVRRATMKLRLLEPMGETLATGDRLDPLTVVAGIEHELIAQVRGVAQAECDLIHWGEMSGTGLLADALAGATAGNRSRTIHTRVLPLADLPASYEEFTARLGKKLRGHVRRQEQIALQQHGLSWRLNDEGASLASAVEAFAELHRQCWQHRGKNGNLAQTRFRAFVERFAESAARRGWLRLHRLCDGSRTVAALLAFHHHGRAYYYQSGWDPAIAKLSPGSLCVARAVRSAIEEGLTVFDFLRGDEPYKRRWSNRQDETITVAEAATLKGQAMLAGRDVKELLKRGIVALGGTAAWEGFKMRLLAPTHTLQPQRGDC